MLHRPWCQTHSIALERNGRFACDGRKNLRCAVGQRQLKLLVQLHYFLRRRQLFDRSPLQMLAPLLSLAGCVAFVVDELSEVLRCSTQLMRKQAPSSSVMQMTQLRHLATVPRFLCSQLSVSHSYCAEISSVCRQLYGRRLRILQKNLLHLLLWGRLAPERALHLH